METRNIGENFNVVVSTKKTLFNAPASDFNVYYANVNSLNNKTVVAGGATEATINISAGSEHKATTNAPSAIGSKVLIVSSGHNIVEGDTISYGTGLFSYVSKTTDTKIYLKTGLVSAVANGTQIVQSNKLGEYVTANFSIPTAGEYIVTVEGSKYGILTEQRVKVIDTTSNTPATDPDAPTEYIAVAY